MKKNCADYDTPLISVCVSIYNVEEFLRECIDSILNQSFSCFELLIVDDGSIDCSRDIVESYQDPRIHLIVNNHDFIASLNLLLERARGKYIARMDADDRMMQDRLLWQYEYMEAHPEVDVLGGGVRFIGKSAGNSIPSKSNMPITILDMLHCNQISNPTAMLRRATLEKYHLRYEKTQYIFAQDYRLWMKMLQLNLHLENLSEILIEYRVSNKQVSHTYSEKQNSAFEEVRSEVKEWIIEKEHPYLLDKNRMIPSSNNQLTVIITFLNEGEEVVNTVRSIRQYVDNSVDIIVINDHSYDGYDYYRKLSPYHVHYVYNSERKGVAASRDLGVQLCNTPFFLLLDAHMRFYDNQWADKIIKLLAQNDRCVLCCQTRTLTKDRHGHVFEKKNTPIVYGAYIPFMKNSYLPDIKWKSKEYCPRENMETIPAILGAGYAASKRYWNYIRGLEGLQQYGCDEAYLSLKVWLEGGQCLLLKDLVIGHIYREDAPYITSQTNVVYNHLFVCSVLFPISLQFLSFAIAQCLNRKSFDEAVLLLSTQCKQQKELKAYYHQIFTVPFEEVIKRLKYMTKFQIYQTSLYTKDLAMCLQFPPNHT